MRLQIANVVGENASRRPSSGEYHSVSASACREEILHASCDVGVLCLSTIQKCHPGSNGETVNWRSPVCGFLTNKGRRKPENIWTY